MKEVSLRKIAFKSNLDVPNKPPRQCTWNIAPMRTIILAVLISHLQSNVVDESFKTMLWVLDIERSALLICSQVVRFINIKITHSW